MLMVVMARIPALEVFEGDREGKWPRVGDEQQFVVLLANSGKHSRFWEGKESKAEIYHSDVKTSDGKDALAQSMGLRETYPCDRVFHTGYVWQENQPYLKHGDAICVNETTSDCEPPVYNQWQPVAMVLGKLIKLLLY